MHNRIIVRTLLLIALAAFVYISASLVTASAEEPEETAAADSAAVEEPEEASPAGTEEEAAKPLSERVIEDCWNNWEGIGPRGCAIGASCDSEKYQGINATN
jgi:hypothetical protein